jgi:hypothetical protein
MFRPGAGAEYPVVFLSVIVDENHMYLKQRPYLFQINGMAATKIATIQEKR